MKNIKDFLRNFSKKQIISFVMIIILMLGIPVGVYLVQNTQIFKSSAYQDEIFEAFEFKDSNGNVLSCDTSTNPPTCTTSTQDITIKIKDLDALIPK